MPSTARARGKEHIPNYPPGFIVLRCLQLFFSLITLGLASYSVSWVAFVGDCFMIFTSVITWIVCLWLICAHSCAPRLYNYWAVLAFDILLYIFWLIAFALMAAEAVLVLGLGSSDLSDLYDDDWLDKRYSWDDYGDYYYDPEIYGPVLAAGAGIGAIEFLLFFISLIIHSVVICRHRRAGLHNKPTSGSAAAPIQMVLQPGGGKPTYEAVPQHGMPFAQDTAYSPAAMYNSPHVPQAQQQLSPHGTAGSYYNPQAVMPQHTGGSFGQPVHVTPTPPPQGAYQVPHQQPYQPYQS